MPDIWLRSRAATPRVGWNQIRSTPLLGMNLDRIIRQAPASLAWAGSPAYIRQALRTLRRLLAKAVEWKVIAVAPSARLVKVVGRDLTMDPKTEAKLLTVAKQPPRYVPRHDPGYGNAP
jgi:hypothetical protein